MLVASADYSRDIKVHAGTLRIRPVEGSNLAELIHLGEATGLSPWTAQCYLEEIKNCSSIMLRLVSEENQIIGFVVGRLVPSSEDGLQDAEIYNIAVHTSAQGEGMGGLIFEAFLGICLDHKAANIWLEVRESNEKAIRFYRKKGFNLVQTRPNFYTNPEESALVMKMPLEKRLA